MGKIILKIIIKVNNLKEDKKIEENINIEEDIKIENLTVEKGDKDNKYKGKKGKENEKFYHKSYKDFDEVITQGIKNKNLSLKEFLNLIVNNAPLCEENMYGVVFLLEFVEFNNKEKIEDKKEELKR